MWAKKYKDCIEYIDSYWDKIIIDPQNNNHANGGNNTHSKGKKVPLEHTGEKIESHAIDVPRPFLVPNDRRFKYAFYWDTFFMFRGLIQTKREWVLRSMVDNFSYLFGKYHIIPNFNSHASTGRSQPPLFTSMILDTYNGYYFAYLKGGKTNGNGKSFEEHKKWLWRITELAKEEYWNVWIDEKRLFHHSVDGYKLNRYGDRDIGYAHSSELESGWDFTSRFYNRCDDFLPIDLNVYLFKYERDFAKIAFHLGDKKEELYWKKRAGKRKNEINNLMWNDEEGFFFDYGFAHKRQSDFLSLAGFTPLWAGLATKDQAEKVVKKLPVFETDHGLVITAKESLAPKIQLRKLPIRFRPAIEEILTPKQWDYPNSWPPLEYLTVIGLLKYGYVKDAKRIMEKSVQTHATIFRKYGTFFEKIDGVKGDKPKDFHYDTQTGFGWTNAIFYRYINLLDAIEKKVELYAQPKSKTPPFRLTIVH